ncbi:MAG: hypothetical protein M0P07_01840 [Candidatus Methanomethylophilaceae archaeon]|nr:hypothetical protein [Candidatus Methanomethylophilaceae archaeon]MDD3378685.1 hypothetical protein [Candidatus Methanomethylophilaceae archaeon]
MASIPGFVEKCDCPKTECPRHGKCCECVAYHRDEKQNIPVCLRPFIPQ